MFWYSQLAEAPADRAGEPVTCDCRVPDVGPENRLSVPVDLRDRIAGALAQAIRDHQLPDRARLLYEDGRLYAACTFADFEAAVEFSGSSVDGRLDLTARGVGRPLTSDPGADDIRAWAPLEVVDREPPTIRFAGTEIFDSLQVSADLFGESCVFPAARYVFEGLCDAHRTGDLYPPDDAPPDRDPIPTLVGHSLGGAAVQYITLRRAHPLPGSAFECDGVKAYAFGSIGLEAIPSGGLVASPNTLESYVSDCDWMTQWFFDSRFQGGTVTSIESGSHTLDAIQADLCSAVRGKESLRIELPGSGLTNSGRCAGRCWYVPQSLQFLCNGGG